MGNKYNQVMEHIRVTEETHDRILAYISQNDFSQPTASTSIAVYKRYIAVAACFLILFLGTMAARNLVNVTHEPPQQAVPDIVTYGSAAQLSSAVGFSVKEISEIPFSVQEVEYTAYWKELAQMQYTGQHNNAVLRMAVGSKDISGDYGQYSDIETCRINSNQVTLKGENKSYTLAVWQSEGYSYSLQFDKGIPQQEMVKAIESLK